MKKNNVLIVYGTRYGATESTVAEMAKIFQEKGFNVKTVNAKEEKVRDISEFKLVIIGSGMKMERWVSAVEGFLKKFSNELKKTRVAIFVSSGGRALMEHKGELDEIKRITKKYLEDKVTKYELNPVSLTMFGGVWDFNKMSKLYRKFLEAERENIIATGAVETETGVYDTRNWDEIRNWTKDLIGKVGSI